MVPWVLNISKPSVRRGMKAGKNETKCGVGQLGGSRSKRLGGKGEVRVGPYGNLFGNWNEQED